ncbi:MAG: homoserine O-acetyltransferase [Porticoccaceae bacterium]|jgi:homoserine O-acetyltransferase|nr:MAG: homoserine O-acetyltransferase [SAR92 bacterium BACL16 MAG-120619-bin48]KRP26220.1 MAG: homoserine O-acetyltransferase [SAR92 bacterium BACL16 MAG-120322-bin99]MDP4655277.1 homoserine O-acetyltransferase [Alphaproteobacteria bacterium]MDP4743933.1 homoserine O-acetyltransferase [Porticoccaceae bacterium]MDP4752498.1 homoserine O-acetyltransferase [Porticoccaceae bacterium]
MSLNYGQNSVGLVTAEKVLIDTPLTLACGTVLPSHELMVETYGCLNTDKSNAILICHALSGHHHAAGFYEGDDKPGWWDDYIGPGKPMDSNRFFIVSLNNIGSCFGSTGPTSTNPATGEAWGAQFPPLRARDWVESQKLLMEKLGIDRWAAVIGGSLGGMQAMRWSLEHPDKVANSIVIASSMRLSAQNIAFNEIARRAIKSDPQFFNGDYLKQGAAPRHGLALARMIGHVTYLSDELMGQKFGRELRSGDFTQGESAPIEFQIESYLNYQGDKFSGGFDANSYILITKMLDYFDLAREYHNNPVEAFSHAQCDFLVISFSSDWRFSPQRSREIVDALIGAEKNVSYAEIESDQGHDAFLLPNPRYEQVLAKYLSRVADQLEGQAT